MKIGILTFHNVPNYGAILQTYALHQYLLCLGHDVSVIDFKCKGNGDEFLPELVKSNSVASNNFLKRALKILRFKFLEEKSYQKKWKKFKQFSKQHIALDNDINDIKNRYDLLFFGSDQIWNPKITNGFEKMYFGATGSGKAVLVSYAASCGDFSDFSENERKEFCSLMENFDYLGVRESSLNEALIQSGIQSYCVVDPTFLISSEQYECKLNLQKKPQKYVLEYALQKDPYLDEIAKKIAKSKNLKLIKISGYQYATKSIKTAGPKEFLEFLLGAEHVVTNSFHGVALSLNFEKNFNVVLPASRKSRIFDILNYLNLTSRICSKSNLDFEQIEYGKVNLKLIEIINESKKFIIQSIRGEKDE